jgi:phosphohistidine phosphatase SixA
MRKDHFCKALLILVASSILLFQPARSNAQAPVTGDVPALLVFVRHAEFAPEPRDNPPLSAAGAKRAQDLAAALSDTKFSAIITSQLLRTRETAQPIAAAQGLTPEVVPLDTAIPSGAESVERRAGTEGKYVKALEVALRKHAGDSVLVVSHSRLGPFVIAALGGPRLSSICESVFDDLFVLVQTAGRMQFIQSRYGAVSPTRGPDCK